MRDGCWRDMAGASKTFWCGHVHPESFRGREYLRLHGPVYGHIEHERGTCGRHIPGTRHAHGCDVLFYHTSGSDSHANGKRLQLTLLHTRNAARRIPDSHARANGKRLHLTLPHKRRGNWVYDRVDRNCTRRGTRRMVATPSHNTLTEHTVEDPSQSCRPHNSKPLIHLKAVRVYRRATPKHSERHTR